MLPLMAYLAGIFTARLLGYPTEYPMVFTLVGAAVTAVLFSLRAKLVTALRPDWWLLLLTIFCTGAWRAATHYPPNAEDFFTEVVGENSLVGGAVARLRSSEYSVRVLVNIEYVRNDSTDNPASGKILIYLPPDSKTASLRVGDRLVVNGRPKILRGPRNPGAFDGKAYWATQGIYHNLYIKDAVDWRHIPSHGFSLVASAEAVRQAWFATFRAYLSDDRLAVATALVLGKKDLLTQEVRSTYAETGATHVLAVSGLHVGIIFLIVTWLFRLVPYRKSRAGRVIETAVTILAIWAFAFVSGLSPSVQRAAIMFTVIAVGKIGAGRTYIVNTLCAAALIMLCIDPSQLFQLGFLLSFMALLGIVWFTTPFNRLLPTDNKVLRAVWSGVGASVGAQVGTLPVALYVFKQFSVLFWLSGSAVVLFAFLTMGAGVLHGAMVGVFGYGAWSDVTGWLLSTVVHCQNSFVYFFGRASWAVFDVRSFPLPSAVLLIAAILSLAAAVQWRRWGYAVISAALVTGSVLLALTQVPGKGRAATMTVYHLRGHSLIDYHSEHASVAIGDSLEQSDLDFNVTPNRKLLGYSEVIFRRADTLTTFTLGSAEWFVLDGSSRRDPDNVPPEFDYVLVRNKFRPKDLRGWSLPDDIILVVDGSNPAYYFDDWREVAAERGLRIWITGVDGALVVPF